MILFVFISFLVIPKMSPPISSSRLYSRGMTWQEKEAWRNKRTSPFGSREKKCWIFGSNSLSFPTKKNREAQLPQFFLGLKDLRGMRAKTREVFTASLIEGEKCTLVCKEKKVVLGPRMCFRKEACLGIK